MLKNNYKKILLTCTILLLGVQAFAYNYDDNFKKEFYNSFINEMFSSIQSGLLSQGYSHNSVNTYINTMRSRLDRNDLENSTWACVSKYSYGEFLNNDNTVVDDCFKGWIDNFYTKNLDALKILK